MLKRKLKTHHVKIFYEIEDQELAENILEHFPISRRSIKNMVDKIHAKLPQLEREMIEDTVLASYQQIQKYLALGYYINFGKAIKALQLKPTKIKDVINYKLGKTDKIERSDSVKLNLTTIQRFKRGNR